MFIRDSMMARLALLVGIVIVTSAYASCSFNTGPPGGPGVVPADTFRTTLLLRNDAGVVTSSFVFGEPIRFTFTIENRTAREVRIQFPDAQTYDFLVADQATSSIRWMWSDGRAFAQVATEVVFAPNETLTFTANWNGTLEDGTQLPVGNYRSRGLLVYAGYETDPLGSSEFASPLVPFTVR